MLLSDIITSLTLNFVHWSYNIMWIWVTTYMNLHMTFLPKIKRYCVYKISYCCVALHSLFKDNVRLLLIFEIPTISLLSVNRSIHLCIPPKQKRFHTLALSMAQNQFDTLSLYIHLHHLWHNINKTDLQTTMVIKTFNTKSRVNL